MNPPVIILPHRFGLKTGQDQIFVPLMLHALACSNPDTVRWFMNPQDWPLALPGTMDWPVHETEVEGLAALRETYRHFSTNTEAFERFCIERFFCLRQLMRQEGLDCCITIETDVLALAPLAASPCVHAVVQRRTEVALSERKCISTAVLTRPFVESWCDAVLGFYSSAVRLQETADWYSQYRNAGRMGGISDMYFCEQLARDPTNPVQVKDFGEVFEHTAGLAAFDTFIGREQHSGEGRKFTTAPAEFEAKIMKCLAWRDGQCWAALEDGTPVQMLSLHLQGQAKSMMGLLYARWRGSLA